MFEYSEVSLFFLFLAIFLFVIGFCVFSIKRQKIVNLKDIEFESLLKEYSFVIRSNKKGEKWFYYTDYIMVINRGNNYQLIIRPSIFTKISYPLTKKIA